MEQPIRDERDHERPTATVDGAQIAQPSSLDSHHHLGPDGEVVHSKAQLDALERLARLEESLPEIDPEHGKDVLANWEKAAAVATASPELVETPELVEVDQADQAGSETTETAEPTGGQVEELELEGDRDEDAEHGAE